MAAEINLASFQSSNFDVSHLVEGLMEEDVRRAKADGGGERCFRTSELAGESEAKGRGQELQLLCAACSSTQVLGELWMAEWTLGGRETSIGTRRKPGNASLTVALLLSQPSTRNPTSAPSRKRSLSSSLSGKPMLPRPPNSSALSLPLNERTEGTSEARKLDSRCVVVEGGEAREEPDLPGEQTVSTQFHALESNITNVARTAVRIGTWEVCDSDCVPHPERVPQASSSKALTDYDNGLPKRTILFSTTTSLHWATLLGQSHRRIARPSSRS